MMNNRINIPEKIYRFLLHQLSYQTERLFSVKRRYWAKQKLSAIEDYWKLKDDESSKVLVSAIEKYSPRSILEVGCNCGNRIYPLAKKYSEAEILGIDINPIAVEKGNEWLRRENIHNVRLLMGSAEKISDLAEMEFDIVFSWAVLIYIRPEDIINVLSRMWQITKKAMIIIEMQGVDEKRDPEGIGIYCYPGNWKRDYIKLMKEIASDQINSMRVTELPEKIWAPGGGGATLLEIRKSL